MLLRRTQHGGRQRTGVLACACECGDMLRARVRTVKSQRERTVCLSACWLRVCVASHALSQQLCLSLSLSPSPTGVPRGAARGRGRGEKADECACAAICSTINPLKVMFTYVGAMAGAFHRDHGHASLGRWWPNSILRPRFQGVCAKRESARPRVLCVRWPGD